MKNKQSIKKRKYTKCFGCKEVIEFEYDEEIKDWVQLGKPHVHIYREKHD